MALYLPIRATSRSQQVRIGSQKISPTATSYVDISVTKTRRELQNHTAIGAVIVVGALSSSNSDVVVSTGGTFTAGAGLGNSSIAAGELRTRSTGVHVAIVATATVTFTANASGNPRIDLVQVDNTTGVVAVTAGTAAASPVAPATPAGKTPLYTVAIANAASAPGAATDVRPRP